MYGENKVLHFTTIYINPNTGGAQVKGCLNKNITIYNLLNILLFDNVHIIINQVTYFSKKST